MFLGSQRMFLRNSGKQIVIFQYDHTHIFVYFRFHTDDAEVGFLIADFFINYFAVGGFDIAAMTGAFLGGALYHVPIIMDGFISGVAALCAVKLCPAVAGYILPSHISAEPAGRMLMEEMGFAPMIHGDLRLGEGTGAVALMPLLDMAVSVYRHAATFEDIQVEAYEKWKSN